MSEFVYSFLCLRSLRVQRTSTPILDTYFGLRVARARAGFVFTWIFDLWGSADLLNAFYQANHAGLLPGQLGAAYFIPTVVVPLLVITHGLVFRILLQHRNESTLIAQALE
jgi:hypothetical protein